MSESSEILPQKPRKPKARFTEENFHSVYGELIDENPLAVRAVLRILDVEFTERVPTLAVTLEERPRLLVNLAFIAALWRWDGLGVDLAQGKRRDEE